MRYVFFAALAYVAIVAFLARKKLPQLHPRRFFLETWAEVDARASAARALRAPVLRADGTVERLARFDWRPVVAYVCLAAILTLQHYYGDRATFFKLRDVGWVIDLGAHRVRLCGPLRWLASARYGELYALAWWVVTRGGGFALIPCMTILLWRERIRDYGLSLKGFVEHAWIYALFFGIVLVAVVLVSQTRDFATFYPIYSAANRSWRDLFYWELMHATEFFALEFLFRGYLMFSSEKSLGSGVIVAMIVPYCMIHFGKPVLETFAAIFAGAVLGTLALKTRSIWSGFLIHVTVAISMDLVALVGTRGLPGGFRLGGW